MANKLKYINDIEQGKIIQSWHVSQSVEAFSSTDQQAYDISVSGSFKVTGSTFIEPNNLLKISQQYVLGFNDTTGQIFKMLASGGSSVYRTGSALNNIIPLNFGDNKATGSRSSILAGCSNVINSIGVNGVIGGGEFNLINESNSFIGGGSLNTGSGKCSFIGAGVCNTISGYASNSAIISGCKNQLPSSYGVSTSTIASGQQNSIDSSYQSFIGGGFLNELGAVSIPSSNQFIGAGSRNKICVSQGSANLILGGSINEIEGGYFGYGISMYNNSIIGGCNNCITFYQNGYSNTVQPHSNFIGAGKKNIIGSNRFCVIVGSHSGIVAGTLNTASGCNSFIGAGSNNNVRNWRGSNSTTNSAYSNASIVGGLNNCILASPNTFIGGGKENIISTAAGYYSNQSTIVAGTGSRIENAFNSFIGSGCKNTIGGPYSNDNIIVGGEGNCISGPSTNSTIVGGINNFIYGSSGLFIGGGNCNSIAGSNSNTVIVGGMCNANPYGNSYTFIGAGCKNNMYGSFRSGIVAGNTNTLNGAGNAFIGAGTNNYIYSGTPDSTIVAGRSNKISGYYSYSNFIGAGCSNCIISNYPNPGFQNNSIVGGNANCINHGKCSSILGGNSNFITSSYFTSIMGGNNNCINNGTKSAIIVGGANTICALDFNACNNFIGAGDNNFISARFASILTGGTNKISGSGDNGAIYSSIVNGSGNHITGSTYAFIGSGLQNKMSGSNHGAILTGTFNTASGARSIIVGGSQNSIIAGDSGQHNFIGSGFKNCITGSYNVIVGGLRNTATGSGGTIAGGCFNIIAGNCNFIGGGQFNSTSGSVVSVVGGGSRNSASADYGFIGAGSNNEVCSGADYSGILGGDQNTVDHCKSFIIGSNIASHAACTTHVNNFTVSGSAGGTSVVIMRGLPISDPANAGQLWNDGGTLKISAG